MRLTGGGLRKCSFFLHRGSLRKHVVLAFIYTWGNRAREVLARLGSDRKEAVEANLRIWSLKSPFGPWRLKGGQRHDLLGESRKALGGRCLESELCWRIFQMRGRAGREPRQRECGYILESCWSRAAGVQDMLRAVRDRPGKTIVADAVGPRA